jgi:SAM-dependent methyltransferase
MKRPHDSWADVYELAYQEEFGSFYERLTQLTVREIGKLVDPPSSIVDFGAGTGRLSLPLARAGYQVTAVEPSAPMLQQLSRAADDLDIVRVEVRMQDFRSAQRFDLAICVFTVIIYLLDDEEMLQAIMSARHCLKPGGLLLLDVPSAAVFGSRSHRTDRIVRTVSIQPVGGDLFEYTEEIELLDKDGDDGLFSDQFLIRAWTPMQVLELARRCGLELVEDLSDRFAGSGSNYYLLSSSPRG